MSTVATRLPPQKPGLERVPPLESGDRLSREEFERRYEAMPENVRAELIEGIVYVSSPARFDYHAKPQLGIISWLGHYIAGTPGVEGGCAGTVRLDDINEPQPDGFLLILPRRGGQAGISDDNYVVGAPDFIAEVSASTASYDLHSKKEAYRRNQVREYLAWRVFDQALDWFALQGGNYEVLPPGADGIYRSRVFPGLWLDPQALLGGDLKRLIEILELGLASPEHAGFAERLAGSSSSS
ncbi:MAG: Uma2 family endonuclease [Planctomycetes bacterium]|nr:Uma2 family endonuclease [Planctomycetota bacterium]